jgi:hypothetical protein
VVSAISSFSHSDGGLGYGGKISVNGYQDCLTTKLLDVKIHHAFPICTFSVFRSRATSTRLRVGIVAAV